MYLHILVLIFIIIHKAIKMIHMSRSFSLMLPKICKKQSLVISMSVYKYSRQRSPPWGPWQILRGKRPKHNDSTWTDLAEAAPLPASGPAEAGLQRVRRPVSEVESRCQHPHRACQIKMTPWTWSEMRNSAYSTRQTIGYQMTMDKVSGWLVPGLISRKQALQDWLLEAWTWKARITWLSNLDSE